ncbi:MAG: nucleotide exchange factor GrpE [Candidatus Methylomirabilales bacterium]
MSEDPKQEEMSPESGQDFRSVSERPAHGEETAAEEDLSQKVAILEKELQELQDRYLRLAAEFDNYKKRVVRERAELTRTAHEGLLLELFPVLDNLERALAAARVSSESSRAQEALIDGVEITLRLFKGVLDKEGVKEIESVGQQFDPSIHHAVEQVQTKDHPESTVVEEVLRGYLLDHKVLRPALVKVSAGPGPRGEIERQSKGGDGE